MQQSTQPIGAVILCGGRSRRMGSDKACIEMADGRRLLRLVIDRLSSAIPAQQIVVASRDGQSLPDLPPSVRVVVDAEPDQGPMGGIVAGLEPLASEVELSLLLAVDSPAFAVGLVELFASQIGRANAVVPQIGSQLYPLTALYRTKPSVSAAVEFYNNGGRRVVDWLQDLEPTFVDSAILRSVDATLASFAPCNTPEELGVLRGN